MAVSGRRFGSCNGVAIFHGRFTGRTDQERIRQVCVTAPMV